MRGLFTFEAVDAPDVSYINVKVELQTFRSESAHLALIKKSLPITPISKACPTIPGHNVYIKAELHLVLSDRAFDWLWQPVPPNTATALHSWPRCA